MEFSVQNNIMTALLFWWEVQLNEVGLWHSGDLVWVCSIKYRSVKGIYEAKIQIRS